MDFTRVGAFCYNFKYDAGREMDWKAASKYCHKIGAVLAEMETIEENQDIIAHIQMSPHLRGKQTVSFYRLKKCLLWCSGKDFWTGGLNPGLLWIWSNSARPVTTKNGPPSNKPEIPLDDGRCLRLSFDPRLRAYSYRGSDCGARYNYICELPENKSSNSLYKLGRSRKILDEFW